jgi:23S rRNA pseudouridine1911/1915/1917 synthase
MELKETHIVPKLKNTIRFQEYAVGIFKIIPTKSGIKKAIKRKLIFINGNLASTSKYISGNEKIELFQPKDTTTFKKLELDIEVLFEDDYLAIVFKPSGILVSGNKFVTIANGLSKNLIKSTQYDAVKPQPVHRLDYPTSGVLLIGKTRSSINTLSKIFKNKEIKKTYFAITIGKMDAKGILNFNIDTKNATTEYEVLKSEPSKRFEYLNLVKLKPKTGRKHQLRKHLYTISNPILGDKEYYLKNSILKGKGMYLHAYSLDFRHTITEEKIIVCKELPKKFKKIFPDF